MYVQLFDIIYKIIIKCIDVIKVIKINFVKFMLNIFVIYEYNSCPTYLNYSPLTLPKIHLTFMYRKIEIKNGPKVLITPDMKV